MKPPRKRKANGFWEFFWKVITDPRVIAALIGLAAAIVTKFGGKQP
jgi:hypothetical protein